MSDDKYNELAMIISYYWRRLQCRLFGCKLESWSENEWVNGTFCIRCGASKSQAEGDTPHKIIYNKRNSR